MSPDTRPLSCVGYGLQNRLSPTGGDRCSEVASEDLHTHMKQMPHRVLRTTRKHHAIVMCARGLVADCTQRPNALLAARWDAGERDTGADVRDAHIAGPLLELTESVAIPI